MFSPSLFQMSVESQPLTADSYVLRAGGRNQSDRLCQLLGLTALNRLMGIIESREENKNSDAGNDSEAPWKTLSLSDFMELLGKALGTQRPWTRVPVVLISIFRCRGTLAGIQGSQWMNLCYEIWLKFLKHIYKKNGSFLENVGFFLSFLSRWSCSALSICRSGFVLRRVWLNARRTETIFHCSCSKTRFCRFKN